MKWRHCVVADACFVVDVKPSWRILPRPLASNVGWEKGR
jgi:hypothetical protein